MGMKTAISIPDPLFRSAERLAARLGISRSELYCRAVKDLLAQHDQAMVTSRLNEVYKTPGAKSALDPALAAIQAAAIRDENDW